jgi:hypothetical protein|tara:strand:- start:175 stop:417 length:243 start_codon:yes stop_codon:yes gene_type:complete
MAAKGSAARSASGAAMSKYDVEVEKRLQALEAKAHTPCKGGGSASGLEAKLDALIEALNQCPAVTENFPKDSEGNRRISL